MIRSSRPRVVCHMASSIDGRVVVDGWPKRSEEAVHREYERIHDRYDCDGWMCGRITMEPFAGGVRSESEVAREYSGDAREDFVAGDYESYAFAIDPSGRLAWGSNDVNGDHVVAIVSEKVSDEYLRFLRERGVSYLIAGGKDIDFEMALRKIHERFGVKTLLLEGGGRINGSVMAAGLVDEVSLILTPVADGRMGTPALFDVPEGATPQRLVLEETESLDDGLLWLRYRVER
jgi:2,5-diamino-6-(ribosylamino)-4(3H)-pyrimidinone 5'-phosphate reductase